MKICKLQVRNFRNLKKIDFEPSPGLNILVGDNAQGKTSLLEAIYILATGVSFRSGADSNLVKHGSSGYMINCEYAQGERRLESRLEYQLQGAKNFGINKKKASHNHNDRLKVVLFTPDDLFLIKGSPGKRRAFLDFILKQLSGEYYHNLDAYNSVLRKRNNLLKQDNISGKAFRIVNEIFIEKATRLILQRINFVNLLDELCAPLYRKINQGQNEFKARYALSFPIDSDKINKDVLEIALAKHIEEKSGEEAARHRTMVGPHLEDINFYQDGLLARIYASQGQQRNMAITIKLAEIYAYTKIKDDYPVFLLDEVLAELDEGKRRMLLNHLHEANFQTFLTAVKLDMNYSRAIPIWLVQQGTVSRKE